LVQMFSSEHCSHTHTEQCFKNRCADERLRQFPIALPLTQRCHFSVTSVYIFGWTGFIHIFFHSNIAQK